MSTSSTEAEFRAYLAAAQESKWIRKLLFDTYKEQKSAISWSDNQSAVSRSKDQSFLARTKHIEVKYNYIRQAIKMGEFVLSEIPTTEIIADIMTKALDRNKHNQFCVEMNLSPGLKRSVEKHAQLTVLDK